MSNLSGMRQDFFTVPVPDFVYIIGNPPYSLKGEVIKRLYEIGKPEKRVPFRSGCLCSGICERQLEFAYLFEKNKKSCGKMHFKTSWNNSG